ncbi:hypothetical protein LXL04_020516 [Taraxacum kok-saghyz]
MATNPNTLVNSQLPKFNGNNYHHWSIQMKVLCEAQDLWDIVKYGIDKPDNFDDLPEEEEAELKVLKKKDRKALYLISQAVDEIIFERTPPRILHRKHGTCSTKHIGGKRKKRIAEERERGTTFVHREENETKTMFMILSTQETQFNDIWYVDSGCSNHMTGNRGIFVSMDES